MTGDGPKTTHKLVVLGMVYYWVYPTLTTNREKTGLTHLPYHCEPEGTYSDDLLLAIGTLSTLFPPLQIMAQWTDVPLGQP